MTWLPIRFQIGCCMNICSVTQSFSRVAYGVNILNIRRSSRLWQVKTHKQLRVRLPITLKAMAQSITDGESEIAADLAKQSVEMGMDPLEAINMGFVAGVNFVGDQFSCGNMFLPELVMAGEAMKAAVAVLEPELARRGPERKMLGKVVLCTVEGAFHEIGKTLVGTMLSATGFQVIDMGVDVPVMKVVEKEV